MTSSAHHEGHHEYDDLGGALLVVGIALVALLAFLAFLALVTYLEPRKPRRGLRSSAWGARR